MKTNLILLACIQLTLLHPIEAQQVSWASSSGNSGSDQGYDISNDALGNVYVTGWFSGTAQFGNQTIVSCGLQDIFLASIDSIGNLNWIRRAGSISNEVSAGIATTPNGDTYITGWFKDTCSFSDSTVISNGSYDMFVAKYDITGTIQWVRSGGGSLDDYGNRATVTSDGGVTVAGSFKSNFTASGLQMNSNGNRDALICHYAPDGQLIWMKGIGGGGEDRAYGIVQDANENYFVTGLFSDVVNFDGTILTSNSFYATYLAKLTSQGTVLWAVKGDAGANDFARGFGVIADQQGNVIANGFFSGTLNMGGSTLSASGGQYDQNCYLIKFDTNGSIIWARNSGGTGTDQGTDLYLTNDNDILEVGFFNNTATFNTANITTAGLADVFVAKYDTAGNILSAFALGGTGNEYAYGITSDGNGNIFITGAFTGSSQMGTFPLVSNGGNDIFIAKLVLSPLGLSPYESISPASIYPNPTIGRFQLDCSALKQKYKTINLAILDEHGKTVYKAEDISEYKRMDASQFSPGLYLIRLFGNGFTSTTKLVVQ